MLRAGEMGRSRETLNGSGCLMAYGGGVEKDDSEGESRVARTMLTLSAWLDESGALSHPLNSLIGCAYLMGWEIEFSPQKSMTALTPRQGSVSLRALSGCRNVRPRPVSCSHC